jgi:hypothetical protein
MPSTTSTSTRRVLIAVCLAVGLAWPRPAAAAAEDLAALLARPVSPGAFDLEAIRALFGAKMTPATLGGEPVDTYISYAVRFSLRR